MKQKQKKKKKKKVEEEDKERRRRKISSFSDASKILKNLDMDIGMPIDVHSFITLALL